MVHKPTMTNKFGPLYTQSLITWFILTEDKSENAYEERGFASE